MAISQTCGNCGSSIELDRGDEVQLWRDWQRNHLCKATEKGEFFSAVATVVEQSESKLGFTRSTQFDDEDE